MPVIKALAVRLRGETVGSWGVVVIRELAVLSWLWLLFTGHGSKTHKKGH